MKRSTSSRLVKCPRGKKEQILLRNFIRESLNDKRFDRHQSWNLISDWDLAHAYVNGVSLLSESSRARGQMIMESVLSGLRSMVAVIGGQVGSAWSAVQRASAAVKRQVDSIVMALLARFPWGRDAFEMLKEFASNVYEDVSSMISEAFKEFVQFMKDSKESMLKFIFKHLDDGTVQEAVSQTLKKVGEEAQEIFDEVKKNPLKALSIILGGEGSGMVSTDGGKKGRLLASATGIREFAGVIVKTVTSIVFRMKRKVASDIVDALKRSDFMKRKGVAVIVIKVINILTGKLSGEDLVIKGIDLYKAIKTARGPSNIDLSRPIDAIKEELPVILQGLVSGDNPAEQIIRAMTGGITDPVKLGEKIMKKAVGAIVAGVRLAAGKYLDEELTKRSIDPSSKTGRLMIAGIKALLGDNAAKVDVNR